MDDLVILCEHLNDGSLSASDGIDQIIGIMNDCLEDPKYVSDNVQGKAKWWDKGVLELEAAKRTMFEKKNYWKKGELNVTRTTRP